MPRNGRRHPAATEPCILPGPSLSEDVADPSEAGGSGEGATVTAARGSPGRSEGRLKDDEQKFRVPRRKRVPLKNGRRMDIEEVHDAWHGLQRLRRRHPAHFQTLLALVQNQPEGVSQESIDYLQRSTYLSPDGNTIRQDIRDVLLSAGPELEDPCRNDSMKDKLTVAMAREERDELFCERLAKNLRPGKGGKKGRSPE